MVNYYYCTLLQQTSFNSNVCVMLSENSKSGLLQQRPVDVKRQMHNHTGVRQQVVSTLHLCATFLFLTVRLSGFELPVQLAYLNRPRPPASTSISYHVFNKVCPDVVQNRLITYKPYGTKDPLHICMQLWCTRVIKGMLALTCRQAPHTHRDVSFSMTFKQGESCFIIPSRQFCCL